MSKNVLFPMITCPLTGFLAGMWCKMGRYEMTGMMAAVSFMCALLVACEWFAPEPLQEVIEQAFAPLPPPPPSGP